MPVGHAVAGASVCVVAVAPTVMEPAWPRFRGSVPWVHFTEFDTRLAAYGLLISDDDQILLTWFNGGGRTEPGWTMPGGGVEFDESIEDAVAREVFEETGYTVDVGDIVAEHHFTLPRQGTRRPMRSQQFLLTATITGGALGTTETDGTTDFAAWVPLGEVTALHPRADIIELALDVLRQRNH